MVAVDIQAKMLKGLKRRAVKAGLAFKADTLDELAATDPETVELIKLRFYAGLADEQAALGAALSLGDDGVAVAGSVGENGREPTCAVWYAILYDGVLPEDEGARGARRRKYAGVKWSLSHSRRGGDRHATGRRDRAPRAG